MVGGGAVIVIGGIWYYLSHKKDVFNPDDVELVEVVYKSTGAVLSPGGQVQADITWKNVGTKALAPSFRLDLKPVRDWLTYNPHWWALASGLLTVVDYVTEQATVFEGVKQTAPSVQPGKTGTFTIKSKVLPMDWEAGMSFNPRLVLIGKNGLWDTTATPEFTIAPQTSAISLLGFSYLPASKILSRGNRVTVNINWKNTGSGPVNQRFRLDLKNSKRLTVYEGQELTSATVAAGESTTTSVDSLVIPEDWFTDSSPGIVTPRVMLIGRDGVWNTADSTSFTLATALTKGTLVLTLNPATAYFEIDGNGTRLTTGSHELSVGSHTWECSQLGYKDQAGTIVVTAGGSVTLAVTLTASLNPTLTCDATTTGTLNFQVKGFPPNLEVNVSVIGKNNYVNVTTGGESGLLPYGEANGSIMIPEGAGTFMLKASGAGYNVTANFERLSGAVILDYFWVYCNPLSGYTDFAVQFLDSVTGVYVDGGIWSLSGTNYATFLRTHNKGKIALAVLSSAGWSAWQYTDEITIANGQVFHLTYVPSGSGGGGGGGGGGDGGGGGGGGGTTPPTCPEGFHWDESTQSCMSDCAEGYYWDHATQSCKWMGYV